jgi:hypothetical protein
MRTRSPTKTANKPDFSTEFCRSTQIDCLSDAYSAFSLICAHLRNLWINIRLPFELMPRTLHLVGLGAILLLAGCASIMSGRHADVAINSNVANAHVVVRDDRGQQVAAGQTPATIALKRKGRLLRPPRYVATIEAPGYQPAEIPIRSTVNPWVLGNVVFGGVIGLVVDNVTGATWKPKQSKIYQELTPQYAQDDLQPDGMQTVSDETEPAIRSAEDRRVEPAGRIY